MRKVSTTPSGAKEKDTYLKIVTSEDHDFFEFAHKHGLIDKEMSAVASFLNSLRRNANAYCRN